MKSMSKLFKKQFTTIAICVISLCVAINYVAGTIAALLKLPIFLDTIGTVFASMLCGPLVGIATGILTSIVASITMPTMMAFVFVNIALAITTGILAYRRMFSTYLRMAIASLIMAAVSIIISAPIVVLLFSGFTGGGSSIIAAILTASGSNIWVSVFSAEGFFTLVDRIITIALCVYIIHCLPQKLLLNFALGKLYIKPKPPITDK